MMPTPLWILLLIVGAGLAWYIGYAMGWINASKSVRNHYHGKLRDADAQVTRLRFLLNQAMQNRVRKGDKK